MEWLCISGNPQLIHHLLQGNITQHDSPAMVKGCTWYSPVKEVSDLLTTRSAIVVVGEQGVAWHKRGGYCLRKTGKDLTNIVSACFSSWDQNSLVVGGDVPFVWQVDSETGATIRKSPLPGSQSMLRSSQGSSRLIAAAGMDGKLRMLDPRTLQPQHTVNAHGATTSSVDVKGDLVASCGWVNSAGGLRVDPYAKIWDIRTMKSLVPIPFPPGPTLCTFHPTFSSILLLLSQDGRFSLAEAQLGASQLLTYDQISHHGAAVISADISTTGLGVTFGMSDGYTALWMHSEHPQGPINSNCAPPLLPEAHPNLPQRGFPDCYTASVLVIPPPNDLLSAQPPDALVSVGKRPVPISDAVLESVKPGPGGMLVGPKPHGHRNQIEEPHPDPVAERAKIKRSKWKPGTESGASSVQDPKRPPARYRYIEVRPQGFQSLEDVARGQNRTVLGGLENGMPNCYVNSWLQVLYFLAPIRAHLMNHLCSRAYCLSCELGFLFHMLDHAEGLAAQASNFLRTFRQLPQAGALRLFEAEDTRATVDIARMMEALVRFMPEQIHLECLANVDDGGLNPKSPGVLKKASDEADAFADSLTELCLGTDQTTANIIEAVFGANYVVRTRCMVCGAETNRESPSFVIDLDFPKIAPGDSHPNENISFSQILMDSMQLHSDHRAWCPKCGRFQQSSRVRKPCEVPNCLLINCGSSSENAVWWQPSKSGPWVPPRLFLSFETNLLSIQEKASRKNATSHALVAAVVMIRDAGEADPARSSHMVALIKVPPAYMSASHGKAGPSSPGRMSTPGKPRGKAHLKGDPLQREPGWYIFNDWSVRGPLAEDEPLLYHPAWKTPSVLVYAREDLEQVVVPEKLALPIHARALMTEDGIARRREHKRRFVPLSPKELEAHTAGQEGRLVALDCEFVSLGGEEVSVSKDGKTRTVVRPDRMALARVSVVRGDGPMRGVPFIDDFIATQEPVVDYLTRYSGIKQGDLDPATSTHHVTTLKSAYVKFRYLLDHGYRMVGHGLRADFRMLNVLAPPSQVIDTVELFNLTGQRKLSLRFLAAFILQEDIQSETHDSIEDARIALALFRAYEQMVVKGTVEDTIDRLYAYGRQHNWQAEGLFQ